MNVHVCSNAETGGEFGGPPAPPLTPERVFEVYQKVIGHEVGVRDEVMNIWGIIQYALVIEKDHHWQGERRKHEEMSGGARVREFVSLWSYAMEYPSHQRRMPMDVDALVAAWVPIIRGLAAGHTKEEIDRCEFESETHLRPLLAAPVTQLRRFYRRLVEALKADPTIPYFIWSMFEAYGKVIIEKAKDGEIKTLKEDLAREVATLVEKDVQPDLLEAMVGALQWRSEEALEKMKQNLGQGAKPRVRGRESCLFLEVGDARVML